MDGTEGLVRANESIDTETPDRVSDIDGESIILTDKCVERLKKIASPGEMLRLEVDSGGCSGFQYRFNLDNKIGPDDIIIEKDGAKAVIDKESFSYMKGATIDYEDELIRSSFRVVSNPNSDAKCSCGASFSLKTTTSPFKFS